MFRPSKKEPEKKVTLPPPPPSPSPVGVSVAKSNGSVQPFDSSKLVTSIIKAGATPQQAAVVSDRVVSRLEGTQTVPSSQLSSMVARSLSRVNPAASQQYTHFRNQKLSHLPPRKPEAPPAVSTTAPKPPTAQVLAEPTTQEYVTTTLIATGGTPVSIGTRPPPSQQPLPPVPGTRTPPLQQPLPPVPGTAPPPSQQKAPPPPPLTVSASPPDITNEVNYPPSYYTFTAFASGGSPPYTYKWFEGSTLVGNNNTLRIAKEAGDYSFYCSVTDSAGSNKNSNTVHLSLKNAPPTIIVTPSTQTCGLNRIVEFVADGWGGKPPLTYKWYEGDTLIGTQSKLSIKKSFAGTYQLRCYVSDSLGLCSESKPVELKVVLGIMVDPWFWTCTVNDYATFTATVEGVLGGYFFEWYEGSTVVGTSAKLSIKKNNPGDYEFYCKVTDPAGYTQNSITVKLQVRLLPLEVFCFPNRYNGRRTELAYFTTKVQGGLAPYTYKWYEGDTLIGTQSELSILKSEGGTYKFYCVVTDSAGSTYRSLDVELYIS